jgi:hypothetical protein
MNNNILEIILKIKDEASNEVKKVVGNITSSFGEAQKSSNAFANALSDIGKIAAGIGLYKLIDWAVSYTKAMIGVGIETAKFYENTKIGFTTLLKDGKEAQKVIDEIKATALKTPFDVSALLKANQLLISTGLSAKESQKAIVLLGNAILATGGGNDEFLRMAINLQQIKNLGHATALDIRQFAYAGIPIYKMLSEAQKKSVEEIKDMKITYDMLIDAFEKAAQKGGMFYRGIENAAGSFQQIQANLKENLDVFFADILTKSGIFDGLKLGMLKIQDALVVIKPQIISFIQSLSQFIQKNQTLVNFILIASGVFLGLVSVIGIVIGVFTLLSFVIGLIFSPIVMIIGGISLLIATFVLFQNQITSIIQNIYLTISMIFTQIWTFINNIFMAIFNVIYSILSSIWNVVSYILTQIFTFFQFIFLTIKTLVEITLVIISTIISTILNAIWGVIGTTLTRWWNSFNTHLNNIKNTVQSIYNSVHNWFVNKLNETWRSVENITGKIWNAFKNMANGIMNALRSIKFPRLSISEGSITIMGKEIKYPKLNVDWYEKGGWVRNTGLAVVHAGEYVLSRDMLRGRENPEVGIGKQQYVYNTIYANVNTQVDLDYLAYKLAYQLRNL